MSSVDPEAIAVLSIRTMAMPPFEPTCMSTSAQSNFSEATSLAAARGSRSIVSVVPGSVRAASTSLWTHSASATRRMDCMLTAR
jgi:hypothetical protein